MKALCYRGPRQIVCETMPDATIQQDDDVVVKMTSCGICGSDLHIYHGEGFSPDLGYCVGHEAVGEIVEVGKGIRSVKVGQKVMVPGSVGCGACRECLSGHVMRCLNNAMTVYGVSSNLQGCQAEAIRVPHGDFNTVPIPDGLTDEQALLLTDNLPTAWFGCRNAEIAPGKTVAVVGCGPIGLMAIESAFVMGASTVFAIDLVPDRRAIAASLGARALDPANAVAEILEATHGHMADCAVEAVGGDKTIALAIQLVGREGNVSVFGVNQSPAFAFPMGLAFVKGITFRIGCCSVQRTLPELIPLVQQGRLKPERTITHRLPLTQGEEAYAIFDARRDGALKMVMTP